METNRLSKKSEQLLNQQITNEAQASQLYLYFGVWADDQGLAGVSNLFFRHSLEERNHMMKVITYIMGRNGQVELSGLDEPKNSIKGIKDCFEQVYSHEIENTKAINKIVSQALKEEDWPTWNFGQWFVKEQIEEENLALDLLDKLKIADKRSLYELDRDIGKMKDEADLARDIDSKNP